jgi:uncharacterized membrane protein YeaQ/YmgE (transglycosylase-associated protein family)
LASIAVSTSVLPRTSNCNRRAPAEWSHQGKQVRSFVSEERRGNCSKTPRAFKQTVNFDYIKFTFPRGALTLHLTRPRRVCCSKKRDFSVIGILAGWLAGQITKGRGFGLLGDLIVGIVGSFLGSFIFGLLGIGAYSLLGRLVMSVVGAIVLLWLIRLIKKA